ncbi:MAG: outer membrane protein assembly factor BamA [Gemmatimonadetes bacterium]|nr:outer membrane protein assembly factor BamA [Gemmatimonadota bacterium]
MTERVVRKRVRLWRHGLAAVVVIGLVSAMARGAVAQDPAVPAAPPSVDSIAVEGNARLRAEEIISFTGIQLFQPFNYRSIQRAITALYATSQFDDVQVDGKELDTGGYLLTIFVKERPVLQRWSVRGVEKLDESSVRKKVAVLEGRAIDRVAVARSMAAIDSLYKKKGYFAAEVSVEETTRDSANAVEVAFVVKEGGRVAISQVVIEGNEKFKDQAVIGGMTSRPEGFWWFRKGEYTEDKVEDDVRNRIPQWYADRGHVDLRVLRDTLVTDSTPGKAILKITVDEGKPYVVGAFDVVGNRRFSADQLSLFFPFGLAVVAGSGTDVGAAFSKADWETATGKVRDLYSNNGYISSQVEPEEVRRTGADGKPLVDLRWRIFEGQPATINKIIILGNDVTHERVIREQIVLVPGATFNRDLLIRSYQNVSNLNFFEQPLPAPDVQSAENGTDVDVIFRVTERNTGNVNFGASVGQGVGVGGFLGLEEPNLFGKGKRGKIQWQFGRNINDFNLSYSDPAIRDSRISGTLTLFNSRQRYTVGDLGRIRREGANVQLGFPLFGSRYTRVFASYGFQRNRFTDTPADLADRFRCDESCSRSSLGLSLVRDTRVGLPFPVGGSSITTSGEFNGGFLGGSGQYQKVDLEGNWFTPLGRTGGDNFGGGIQFTLGFKAKSGFVFGEVGPFFYELYSLGGVQYGIPLRGYDEFSITPLGFDPTASGSQVQPGSFGKAYAAFTIEAGARLSQQFYVNIFSDAGNVYGRARQFNPTRLFRSVGAGVALISPLGPIGIDLGYGLDRIDQTGKPKPGWQLHFRLGNFF